MVGVMTRPSPSPYFYPSGTDVLSPNRRLLKNEIQYILSSCSVTIDTVPHPLPLTLNLMLGMYIYNRGFIPRFPFQNHVPHDIVIYQFLRAVIESYADGLTGPGHSIDHPVCIVFWPTTRNFRNAL